MIFLSRIWLTQIRGNEALGTGKYGAETRGISQAREPPNTHINAGKINHPGVILQLIHAAFPKGQPRWRGITARPDPPLPLPHSLCWWFCWVLHVDVPGEGEAVHCPRQGTMMMNRPSFCQNIYFLVAKGQTKGMKLSESYCHLRRIRKIESFELRG